MERLFGGRSGVSSSHRQPAFPALNVWQDDDKFFVESELPGVSLDDLELTIQGNQLTIEGQRRKPELEDKNVSWHRQERGFGTFKRVLELPEEVKPDGVTAKLNDGVLLIELLKREELKPRKITINAS
jgi:HSP20 family protein